MTDDKLKPCPFCGGEPERITITEDDEPDNAGGDVITCLKCGASSHVEFGHKENLVEHWNTRATDTQVSSLVSALERIELISAGSICDNGRPDIHEIARAVLDGIVSKSDA